jgi:hypothetical protein
VCNCSRAMRYLGNAVGASCISGRSFVVAAMLGQFLNYVPPLNGETVISEFFGSVYESIFQRFSYFALKRV